jgi:hypothetical protein
LDIACFADGDPLRTVEIAVYFSFNDDAMGEDVSVDLTLTSHREVFLPELYGAIYLSLDDQVLFTAQVPIDLDGWPNDCGLSNSGTGPVSLNGISLFKNGEIATLFMSILLVSIKHLPTPPDLVF